MSPKKAIVILAPFIILLILTFIMVFVGQSGRFKKIDTSTTQGNNTQKTNDNAAISESQKMEELIDKKIEEKKKEIMEKPQSRTLEQDEIDFLINPKKTVEQELINEGKAKISSSTPGD